MLSLQQEISLLTFVFFNQHKTTFMIFQLLVLICKYLKMKLCRNLVFIHCLYTRQNDINVFKSIWWHFRKIFRRLILCESSVHIILFLINYMCVEKILDIWSKSESLFPSKISQYHHNGFVSPLNYQGFLWRSSAPLARGKRRLNWGGLSDETWETEVLCHSRCGTIKIPPVSRPLPWFCILSPILWRLHISKPDLT